MPYFIHPICSRRAGKASCWGAGYFSRLLFATKHCQTCTIKLAIAAKKQIGSSLQPNSAACHPSEENDQCFPSNSEKSVANELRHDHHTIVCQTPADGNQCPWISWPVHNIAQL
jgi:hypothetical protein